MKTTYKGIEIQYDEDFNSWDCSCDYGKYSGESLVAVKSWIDRQEKKKFQRYEVIVKVYYGLEIATVTSEKDSEVWIKYKNGTKEKARKKNIVKKTDDNIKLYNQIKEVEKELKIFSQNKESEIQELTKILFKEGEYAEK